MSISSLNSIDLGFFALVLLSCLIGVFRGITREVLGIAGWIGAILAATYSIPLCLPLAQTYISSPALAKIVTGIVVFIVALSILMIISKTLSHQVKSSALGGVDRSLGLLFGIVRAVIVACIFYSITVLFIPTKDMPEVIKTARITPWIRAWSMSLQAMLPTSMQTHFKEKHAQQALEMMEDVQRLHHQVQDMEKTVEKLSTLRASSDLLPSKKKEANEPNNDIQKVINDKQGEEGKGYHGASE